mmetsp:Transcript_3619/g.5387  ORF Transcript_3619/g.5387 Transcript_3619/m.5387 type:complete len:183 (+) Transcript_3619:114-662(+)
MFGADLHLPSMPPNTVGGSNVETLRRLGRELTLINNGELAAADAYRLYHPTASTRPCWGYSLEAAREDITNEIVVLFRSDENYSYDRALRWVPLAELATRKQAQLTYHMQEVGPAEDVVHEILGVFRDVFEFAVAANWSHEKRLEFYHSFPFEEMTSKEAVIAFRPVLFGCSAFEDFVPEIE